MNDNGWLVIITKPNQEGIALAQLVAQAYEPFLPLSVVERRRGRKIATVRVPLFTGYVFVRYIRGETDLGPIISTRGVSRIIASREGRPALLDEVVVDEIRNRMHSDGGAVKPVEAIRKIFLRDDPIAIIEGPLAGFSGLFVSNEEDRVTVLLNMLGRPQYIEIPSAAIEPAK